MTALAVSFVGLLLVGVPIVFVLALSGAAGLWALGIDLIAVPSRLFTGMDSFILLAAPFYIFAGEIMNRGGITMRLIQLAGLASRGARGGTAYTNVTASVFFSGISGAAVADTAALGQVFIKGMPQEGYDRHYAAAVTIASSVIGPIIPPSVIMIIYAAVTRVSVIDLFVAGIVPGLLLACACWLVIWYHARTRGLPRAEREQVRKGELLTLVRDGVLVAGLPVLIVAGTLSGAFTATEAGGVAVVYALAITWFVFRSIDLRQTWEALKVSARMTSTVYLIIAAASIVSYVLTLGGLADWMGELAALFKDSPTGFMLGLMLVLLVVGTFLEPGAAIVLLLPMLLPVSQQLGIPHTQFALVVILTLTLGLITPPVGVCLFLAARIAESKVMPVLLATLPFLLAELAVVVLLIVFPGLTGWLPGLLR